MIGKKKIKPENPEMSRQALLWLHPEALLRFMTSKRWVINEGHLPEDAKFHHVYYDSNRQVFAVVMTSKEFKPLMLGDKIPELPPVTFKWWNHEDGEIK